MFDYQLDYKPDTYLWNPLIQKFKALPHSPLSSFTNTRWTALSFGFVPQVNDYAVVHIVKPPLLSAPHPHSVMVGVYSLNSNSWRITSQDNVFVTGVASSLIHPFGQFIAYCVQNEELYHLDMWVLRGNTINEFSWEKKMSVSLREDLRRPEVLGLRSNGEPILFNLYDFVSYSLDSHEANDFVHSWDRWSDFSFYEENFAPPFSISPFVESLVLLN
ncbi:hypothetical protein POM88_037321 [Heracleum sosnowskyi]|uniref:F-box protein n=1 Tax=Heracleum sosnowskyi TaxID=360622 RepID=A0AAD8HPY8_9APIA|nr:hypothetical protein POM88_037321 [Heracleum sosnowskyi]